MLSTAIRKGNLKKIKQLDGWEARERRYLPQLLVGERVLEGLLVFLRPRRIPAAHGRLRGRGTRSLLALWLRFRLDHHHLSLSSSVAAVRRPSPSHRGFASSPVATPRQPTGECRWVPGRRFRPVKDGEAGRGKAQGGERAEDQLVFLFKKNRKFEEL